MSPNDRARVVLFDRSPKPVTQWLSSKEALSEKVSRIEKGQLEMSRLMTEPRPCTIRVRRRDRRQRGRMQLKLAESYAEQQRAEIRQLLDGVRSELSLLAPLAGKKVFLFLSGLRVPAWIDDADLRPASPGRAEFEGQGRLLEVSVHNSRRTWRRSPACERLRVTFYTVDARGLEAGGMGIPDLRSGRRVAGPFGHDGARASGHPGPPRDDGARDGRPGALELERLR
jgi:hypothetical protein